MQRARQPDELRPLEIQRHSSTGWHAYDTHTATLANGAKTWSKSVRVKKTGRFRIHVRHSDGDNFAAKSGWREFKVK